ncbi:site-specific DNA-methyltransferase [Rivihabitans pingtungensis]|uniref:site-specific DNA-methyltransferase (adenine-specific) n=1 Tax=Rivihabitans pingtungensis TaxID=1054498 RepID=A0A318L494_9NEIS|nr:site-specific DNA-methyltransferase [Rivihabitans pingtungensis]PXX80273.1 adenine-specific DNA-methyltransferase [Rivihabitans pingtungensis]
MTTKTKLELTWPGKHKRPRLEPRILLEDKALSYHAASHGLPDLVDQAAGAAAPAFDDNLLIHGDNLLALKALESKYTGKIKCVFIDPPYNTGSAFTHYDDGVEHSMWLTLIRDRLEIIRTLLAEDGSLWITIDDNEAHYLKVLGDEVFGRACFITDISWQKRDGPPNDRKIGSIHDHVLVWAKSRSGISKKTVAEEKFNLMPRTEKADAQYQVFNEPSGPDPRGPFRKIDTTANGKGGRYVESLYYPIRNPYTGQDVWPREGTCWRHSKDEMVRLQADQRLFWGAKGTATTPMRKLFKYEAKQGMTAPSIWNDTGLNQHASSHMEKLFGEKAFFETPKPEELLQRVIHIATNPGDLVLDSFAGSGTTGAVAHKMGRRWIMVELGEHCHTHIVPRLKKVIDGQDPGGITKAVGWQGGGGFRYYRLAPSLLKKDKWGHWVINPAYNGEMLSEAMCKLMGFTYAPSQSTFWQHGQSTETDFIYVTTGSLSHDQLRVISEEVGSARSLLICCKAFMADVTAFPNLTLKKIPKTVLHKCEWDHDDYSFSIDVLAEPEEQPEEDDEFALNADAEEAADE